MHDDHRQGTDESDRQVGGYSPDRHLPYLCRRHDSRSGQGRNGAETGKYLDGKRERGERGTGKNREDVPPRRHLEGTYRQVSEFQASGTGRRRP